MVRFAAHSWLQIVDAIFSRRARIASPSSSLVSRQYCSMPHQIMLASCKRPCTRSLRMLHFVAVHCDSASACVPWNLPTYFEYMALTSLIDLDHAAFSPEMATEDGIESEAKCEKKKNVPFRSDSACARQRSGMRMAVKPEASSRKWCNDVHVEKPSIKPQPISRSNVKSFSQTPMMTHALGRESDNCDNHFSPCWAGVAEPTPLGASSARADTCHRVMAPLREMREREKKS